MPRLVMHHPAEGARVFELVEDRPVSIGRAKSSSIMLDDPTVSRLHAVLRSSPDGRWQIIDRSNANGVKINGKPVKEAVLRANDQVTIGIYWLRFEDSSARNITSYGATPLPGSVSRLVSAAYYSGSPLPGVEALGDLRPYNAPDQAGMAGRLKALEDENRLLKILYRVSRMLAEVPTLDDLTRRVLDLVLEIDGAERGYAMLLHEGPAGGADSKTISYSFHPAVIRYRGRPVESRNSPIPQLTISRSIIRQVMQSGLPTLVTDGQCDARFSASESVVKSGIQSAMCAPLGIAQRVRGLLYVDNLSRKGMFTIDDLNVFAVIAVQAGLAIDQVRAGTEASEPTLP